MGTVEYCESTKSRNSGNSKGSDLDLCSVRFERIGCFHDNKEAPRLLPSYLLNDRDENLPNFSGHLIDWKNWYEYLPDLVCRCAKKTKEKGWKLFGIQFWGEIFVQYVSSLVEGRRTQRIEVLLFSYKSTE